MLSYGRRWPTSNDLHYLCGVTANRFQKLSEAAFISHSTNTLKKGMNPIILPPVLDKL